LKINITERQDIVK